MLQKTEYEEIQNEEEKEIQKVSRETNCVHPHQKQVVYPTKNALVKDLCVFLKNIEPKMQKVVFDVFHAKQTYKNLASDKKMSQNANLRRINTVFLLLFLFFL